MYAATSQSESSTTAQHRAQELSCLISSIVVSPRVEEALPALHAVENKLRKLAWGEISVVQHGASIAGCLASIAAAECTCDWSRSWIYIGAVSRAVDALTSRKGAGAILQVVDAGCGPTALLALTAALRSPAVRVVAIEGNPESVARARRVVEALGLEKQISFFQEDARTARLPHVPDLLITETFDAGLIDEQGAEILSHLGPQVAPDGIVLPEKVKVVGTILRNADFSRVLSTALSRDIYELKGREGKPLRTQNEIEGKELGVGTYTLAVSTELSFGEFAPALSRATGSDIAAQVCVLNFSIDESSLSSIFRFSCVPGSDHFKLEIRNGR